MSKPARNRAASANSDFALSSQNPHPIQRESGFDFQICKFRWNNSVVKAIQASGDDNMHCNFETILPALACGVWVASDAAAQSHFSAFGQCSAGNRIVIWRLRTIGSDLRRQNQWPKSSEIVHRESIGMIAASLLQPAPARALAGVGAENGRKPISGGKRAR